MIAVDAVKRANTAISNFQIFIKLYKVGLGCNISQVLNISQRANKSIKQLNSSSWASWLGG